jgi:hypothetical protein
MDKATRQRLKAAANGNVAVKEPTGQPEKIDKSLPKRDQQMIRKGRLPDGATFLAKYNAENKEWFTVLTVEGMLFEVHADGVFKSLQLLDKMYRSATGDQQIK